MALSEDGRANVMALEIIARQLAHLPYAIAENAVRYAPAPPDPPEERAPRRGSWRRGADAAAGAAGLLAHRFLALLGPMAALGTFLNAPTSGLNVFNKAMGLFAASIAPVLLPTLFTLAVGLATAGDVVFKKLVPALEAFDKAVLQTGIPAVVQFADTMGRATEVLKWLADSKLGGAVLGDSGPGGRFGSLNRTLDRAGSPFGWSKSPDGGRSTGESIEAGLDDVARVMLPAGIGDRLVGAKNASKDATNWLTRSVGLGTVFDAPTRDGATRGADRETLAAADKHKMMALRELQIAMLPRPQVGGTAASVWTKAQQAALSQSPWEREMLLKMSEVVTMMTRAMSTRGGGTGTLTEEERKRADRALEEARRGRR